MKGMWAGGLGLSFGWFLAGAAAAQNPQPQAGTLPPIVAQAAAPVEPRPLPVSLGRPIAVTPDLAMPQAPARPDEGVMPASFQLNPFRPGGLLNRNTETIAQAPRPVDSLPTALPPADGLPAGAGATSFATDRPVVRAPAPLLPRPIHTLLRAGAVTEIPEFSPCGEEFPCPCEGEGAVPYRFYGSAEYLLWWIKDSRFPPLVTTSPPSSAGILGMPGTIVLFGGSEVNNEERSGGRFTGGVWLDPCQTWAFEGSYFFLGDRSVNFRANSDQFPVLARPFFNLNAGTEFSQLTASPGLSTGRIDVNSSSRLWGAEGNFRRNLCCGCDYRLDGLFGFRYLELDESLTIGEMLAVAPGVPVFGGDRITVLDNFATHNRFYGGQVGLDGEIRRGRWFADVRGKVALGDVQQVTDINGAQLIVTPAGTATSFRGGLLALSTNIGHFTKHRFAVLPEGTVNVGYQVTDHLRAFVGYNFLYVSSVLRPGDQIDRVIDVTRIPNFATNLPPTGVPRPMVLSKDTDFWAQGINFGLEFRY